MTADDMARALATGAATSAGLVLAALDRMAQADGQVRAFIAVDAAGAMQTARDSDARRAAGAALGPLDGVPVAVKDNIDVAGLPSTDGTCAFAGRIAAADAGVVERLRAAGMVILGKLNLHEGALGATTDNPFWGRCDNPARPGHTPGGSSGGSAAAVAAGFVPVAIGTDTMGSVRIPAAYCGLWGLKPTPGAVPTNGLSLLSDTLDTIGPLAGNAGDLGLVWTALTGQPPLAAAPEGAVFGIPEEIAAVALELGVGAAFDALCSRVVAGGGRLRPVSVAGWHPARLRRAGLLVSEAEAAVRLWPLMQADPDGFSPGFRAMIDYGHRADPARVAAARAMLDAAERAAAQALDGVDALLMPTAPQRAFPHGAAVPDNQADLTALANAARLPALAFPIPVPDGSFPASAQLVGPPGSETRLIAWAGAMA